MFHGGSMWPPKGARRFKRIVFCNSLYASYAFGRPHGAARTPFSLLGAPAYKFQRPVPFSVSALDFFFPASILEMYHGERESDSVQIETGKTGFVEGKTCMSGYDVFISFKSDYLPWVETLAKNLCSQGLKVFLDRWELKAGKGLASQLNDHLGAARNGVIVVTPGLFDSGWVRLEYEKMIGQQVKDPDFKVIPAVLAPEVPDVAFIKNFLYVDFRDPAPKKYKEALYRLVCAVRGVAPGREVKLEGEVEIPSPPGPPPGPVQKEKDFALEVLESLDKKLAVVLLARWEQWQESVRTLLEERAKEFFGAPFTRVLVAPFSTNGDPAATLFKHLAAQCDFPGAVEDEKTFLEAFEASLPEYGKLLLVIRGIEGSEPREQKLLAALLRSINENGKFRHKVRILVSGSEKLADLAYGGELSYLNHTDICEWPEPGPEEIRRAARGICRARGLEVALDDCAVERLMEVSGGHPAVLEPALRLYVRGPGFSDQQLAEQLAASPRGWQLFMPLLKLPGGGKKLWRLLEAPDVGANQDRARDPMIKALYWRNLLKPGAGNRRLYWRCEALRLAGRMILEGGENAV